MHSFLSILKKLPEYKLAIMIPPHSLNIVFFGSVTISGGILYQVNSNVIAKSVKQPFKKGFSHIKTATQQ
jgi:hypothetical protein